MRDNAIYNIFHYRLIIIIVPTDGDIRKKKQIQIIKIYNKKNKSDSFLVKSNINNCVLSHFRVEAKNEHRITNKTTLIQFSNQKNQIKSNQIQIFFFCCCFFCESWIK